MYSSNDEAMGVGLGGFLDVCAVRGMVVWGMVVKVNCQSMEVERGVTKIIPRLDS